ncbi:MAG: hypothetical protein HY897_08060 [Deltaproteobacteria bacterium]|nr:hypothetical protein [Deltaproteobacteria bacterium]
MKAMLWLLLVPLLALVMCLGCAGPRFVTQSTGTKDQMKFLFTDGDEQGVLKCAAGPDGKLTNCREMPVKLND